MSGVFITKGTVWRLTPLTLDLSSGEFISGGEFQVSFDVCPLWAKLSLEHVAKAKANAEACVEAWKGSDEEAKARALEAEFESAIQALMAAAISIDAFYAWLKPHAKLEEHVLEKWRDRGTPRHKQLVEVLRRVFRLKGVGVKTLLRNLKPLYRLRDLAVHPPAEPTGAVLRPDLNVGVEWRFATYSAENIGPAVTVSTAILYDLAFNGRPPEKAVQEHMKRLQLAMDQLFPEGHPIAKKRTDGADDGT